MSTRAISYAVIDCDYTIAMLLFLIRPLGLEFVALGGLIVVLRELLNLFWILVLDQAVIERFEKSSLYIVIG